jgi:nucleoid-associated protein YgaU
MPFLLIFGPIFGLAALVAIFSHGSKSPVATKKGTGAPSSAQQQFELDPGMPEEVVHEVLTALVHGQPPAELDALSRQLAAKYPIAASELRAKMAGLMAASGAVSPALDTGQAAVILQAAMKAYAQEQDPVELEGFAESIREKYPTATILLVGRARELRAAAQQTSPGAVVPGASPAPLTSLAIPSPAATAPIPIKPATYVVQAGDTPSAIAEKLVRDGKRWPELVAANSGKPTMTDGNFVSLRPGETLTLPPSWSPPSAPQAPSNGLSIEAHP